MERESLQRILNKEFPWGTTFAQRNNFESGYSIAEGNFINKYFKSKPSQNILVIGSGNGREARPISYFGCLTVCIDTSFVYLKSGENLFSAEGIKNINFIQADMMYLPFVKESFDFVFSSLYSFADQHRFSILRDIHKILHINGLVLLCSLTDLYKIKYKSAENCKGIIFFTNQEQLSKEVSSCGFELIESQTDPLRPEYHFSILRACQIQAFKNDVWLNSNSSIQKSLA